MKSEAVVSKLAPLLVLLLSVVIMAADSYGARKRM
jgi:hypothetical protein